LTTGGTPHGTSSSTRVTRERRTRSSSMTSATASAMTTSSATDTPTKTTVLRSASQKISSPNRRT
jgi:hypothetical protein